MKVPLRVLHLEDDPNDVELAQAALAEEGIACDVVRVETRADFLAALEQGGFDLILADYSLPTYDGIAALAAARGVQPDVPFIIISGTLGEELAIDTLKKGATDYVLKHRLPRLAPAVRRAIREVEEHLERERADATRREFEARYRSLFNDVPVGLYRSLPDGRIVDANPAMIELLGYPDREALLAVKLGDLYVDSGITSLRLPAVLASEDVVRGFEAQVSRHDGTPIWIRQSVRVVRDEQGRALHHEGAFEDISELKEAHETAIASQRLMRALLLNSEELISILDAQGLIVYQSPSVKRLLGWEPREMAGRNVLEYVHPDDVDQIAKGFAQVAGQPGAVILSEARYRQADGQWLTLEGIGQNMLDDPAVRGIVLVSRDITGRKRAEAHIRHLNQVLRAVRDINHLITHEDDAAQLIQHACEILLKTRDYRLVRVGLIVAGYQWMVTAGLAGHDVDALDESLIHQEGADVEHGLTQAAIRARQPVAAAFVVGNEPHAGWQEAALRRGYASAAAVPLVHSDRLFGALSVYGASPGLFDSEEVSLLTELAGDLAFALQSIEDDAARRRAEAALHANARRFRALIENSADAIALIAVDGIIQYTSPATTRILGYPVNQFVSRNAFELVHEDDLEFLARGLAELTEHPEQTMTTEFRVRHQDGSWRWIEGSATNLLADPIVQGIVVNYRDITERKRAEDALRLSDEILRRVNSLVLVADGQGSIVYVSPPVKAMLGYEPDEVLGDEWWKLTRPDPIERAREKNYVARVARGEVPVHEAPYERLVLSRHQGPRWFLWHDARGPGDRIIGVGHDITERKQREHELEAIVAVATALRAASIRAEMLPVIINQSLSLLKADGAALVMRDMASEEMIVALARGAWADWTGMRIVPGEGLSGYIVAQASSRPCLNNDLAADPRLAHSAQAHDLRAVACVPLIAEEQTIGVLGIGRQTAISENDLRLLIAIGDIAANALHRAQIVESLERRVQERTAELEKARARLQAILDAAGEGIVISDLHQTLEYVNPALERLSGYAAPELVGQSILVVDSGQTSREAQEDVMRTLARGETWRGEVVSRRKDGTLYDVALTITPLSDAEGSLVGFVAIHHDITRLKELDRLKSKFVSDVSHELRTPVANLKLYAELLESGKPEKRDHYMKVLREQADRQAQLVEDILNLSRLEIGGSKTPFEPVDLNALARQVVEAHRPAAEAAGLRLTFTPNPGLQPVRGAPNQLAQVITNLVANAINYTPAGTVSVSADLRHGQVCVEVSDTGSGIDPDDLPHLFERFYRGRGARSVRGTGLGLSIVKEIVDLHGGAITVHSEVGVGTTFTVTLPLQASTTEEARETRSRDRE